MLERWWSLSDGSFRLACVLVGLSDSDGHVTTTASHLATLCRASRSAIRRSLASLVACGFCAVESAKGRHGATSIVVASGGHLEVADTKGESSQIIGGPNIIAAIYPPPRKRETWPLKMDTQVLENVRESLAVLGDRGHLNCNETVVFWPLSRHFASRSRARVQNLRRSYVSDLDLRSGVRSPTSQILCRSEEYQMVPPKTGTEYATQHHAEDTMAQEARESECEQDTSQQADTAPKAEKPKKARADASKIPERAWAAADYLRAQVIAENPSSFASTASWSSGYVWSTGTARRESDGGRTGLRLNWANSFRLAHERLLKALRNADKNTTPEAAWEEIARTVHWLFHGQPASPRFVVHSPDALRDKWDKIQAARRTQQNRPAMGANGRPDTVVKHERKQWEAE